MKRIFSLAVLSFFIGLTAYGQSEVTIHIDKPYYVTGEVVWYKIYMPNAFKEGSGKVKAVVQSSANVVVDESFVQLSNGVMTGYFKIPYDIESGLYHFSFFALENKALKPTKLTKFEVPIYNDINGQGVTASFPNVALRGDVDGDQVGGMKLEVSIDQARHQMREDVNLSAKVVRADGSVVPSTISVSVVDESLLGKALDRNCVFTKPLALEYGVNIGLDERIFIQGNISDAETGNPAKVSVIGAYNSDENKMYYTKSDDNGRFTLLMKDQVGPSTLQIAGYLYDEYTNTSIELDAVAGINPNISMTNVFDTEVASYIEESAKRKRIYQHFNLLEVDVTTEDYAKQWNAVKPNKNLKVNEYVSFATIGKFFDEILGAQLNFFEEDDVVKARMFNPESNKNAGRNADYYFPRSPVFLVDGKMTKNGDYISNMKLDQVQEIDLYYDWRDITKQYGTFGDFGYVVVKTTMADVSLPDADKEDIISYNGLQPKINYPVAITSDDKSLPMLKPLVYWNPTLNVTNNKESQMQFLSSDDAGTFRVIVVAQTEDGQILNTTTSYSSVSLNK